MYSDVAEFSKFRICDKVPERIVAIIAAYCILPGNLGSSREYGLTLTAYNATKVSPT